MAALACGACTLAVTKDVAEALAPRAGTLQTSVFRSRIPDAAAPNLYPIDPRISVDPCCAQPPVRLFEIAAHTTKKQQLDKISVRYVHRQDGREGKTGGERDEEIKKHLEHWPRCVLNQRMRLRFNGKEGHAY